MNNNHIVLHCLTLKSITMVWKLQHKAIFVKRDYLLKTWIMNSPELWSLCMWVYTKTLLVCQSKYRCAVQVISHYAHFNAPVVSSCDDFSFAKISENHESKRGIIRIISIFVCIIKIDARQTKSAWLKAACGAAGSYDRCSGWSHETLRLRGCWHRAAMACKQQQQRQQRQVEGNWMWVSASRSGSSPITTSAVKRFPTMRRRSVWWVIASLPPPRRLFLSATASPDDHLEPRISPMLATLAELAVIAANRLIAATVRDHCASRAILLKSSGRCRVINRHSCFLMTNRVCVSLSFIKH